jgi:hypothetical protein
VSRIKQIVALLAVVALPAAAAHSMFAAPAGFCFASGSTTFRLAPSAAAPDYRVVVERDALGADLRMQAVDRAEMADIVLVDDLGTTGGSACRAAGAVRTVKLEDSGPADVVVNLTSQPGADFKVYVHSLRFSQRDAAALLAAMWKAEQRRKLAASAVR